MLSKTFLLTIIACVYLPRTICAQENTPPLYQDKKTVYSRLTGQEGKNINLTLSIFTKDKIELTIEGDSGSSTFHDTFPVHELNPQPLQNLIVTRLKSHNIGGADQKSITDILESQSVGTVNTMVLAAQAALHTLDSPDTKNITSSFTFGTKVPLYILADSQDVAKLYNLLGLGNYNRKADSVLLIQKRDSLVKVSAPTEALDKQRATQVVAETERAIYEVQSMVNKKKKPYFLVGFVFVRRNELVINSGFARAMRITLDDSVELRYRFGGYKISLARLNISKVVDYNFSIDLRSLTAASHKMNGTYLAVWKNSNEGLKYWTYLAKIFQYDPPQVTDIYDLFVTRTGRIIFDGQKPEIGKARETDINNVIKLNIFTDLVGVQEDQPNGLIQAEGTFTTRLFGWNSLKRYSQNRTYFLDHLEANLRFSKIDNKLRYLNASIIGGGNKVAFVPSFQLLQYDNLESGVKVSVIKIESYKREFNVYAGAGIVRTGIRDTIYEVNGTDTTKIPRTFNMLTFKKFLQASLRIKATSSAGVDVAASLIWLKLLDKDIKQSGGNYSRDGNVYQEFKAHENIIINPQFQAYYLPNRDESQRLYLRAAFFHDLAVRGNSWLNIQVGFSSDINKFLNFK